MGENKEAAKKRLLRVPGAGLEPAHSNEYKILSLGKMYLNGSICTLNALKVAIIAMMIQ